MEPGFVVGSDKYSAGVERGDVDESDQCKLQNNTNYSSYSIIFPFIDFYRYFVACDWDCDDDDQASEFPMPFVAY